MAKIRQTIEYRGYGIDELASGEWGVVTDRDTVYTEGYLYITPTQADAKARVDEIFAASAHLRPLTADEALVDPLGPLWVPKD